MQIITRTNGKKVALGMSGGVDSSVCAHLLIEQGYEVTGVYLECWRAPGCRSEEDRADALKIALELGIPFTVLDFKDAYREKVVEYFFAEYKAGRTPNPDVLCNKEIKFGLFYDWAMEHNFDAVATGHYAKIVATPQGKQLAIPADGHKDQTYFLYLLEQQQLEHCLFPLADYTKTQVRALAAEKKLHVSNKKDSVGICFIGDINVHNFLKERLGENPGAVVDYQGTVLGTHKGLWFYTIGQRSGFTINPTSSITQPDGTTIDRNNIPPFYVIGKRPEQNQLVVGFGAQAYAQQFSIQNTHWITTVENKNNLFVRIRHTGELLPCTVSFENNSAQIMLDQPAKGIAEGQSAVLYTTQENEMLCLGGGVIMRDA